MGVIQALVQLSNKLSGNSGKLEESKITEEIEHCPACNASFDGGLIRETEGFDEIKALEYYGSKDARWCRKIGIEIPEVYDGIIRWRCPDCKHEWGRFPGEQDD